MNSIVKLFIIALYHFSLINLIAGVLNYTLLIRRIVSQSV